MAYSGWTLPSGSLTRAYPARVEQGADPAYLPYSPFLP